MTDDLAPLHDLQRWDPGAFNAHIRQAVTELHAWSGELLPFTGTNNIVVSDGSCTVPIRFQLKDSSDNSVYVKKMGNVNGVIEITGSNNRVIIDGDNPWPSHLRIHVNGHGSTLFIGAGCTFDHTEMFLTGDDVQIVLGEDCMFSYGTMIRTYDQHAMFDVVTGDWCNPPQSVFIGSHAWVGQEVLVLKGTRIGKGCIVGARATVSGTLPATTLSVGAPARVVRSNVSWIRDMKLSKDHIDFAMTKIRRGI